MLRIFWLSRRLKKYAVLIHTKIQGIFSRTMPVDESGIINDKSFFFIHLFHLQQLWIFVDVADDFNRIS